MTFFSDTTAILCVSIFPTLASSSPILAISAPRASRKSLFLSESHNQGKERDQIIQQLRSEWDDITATWQLVFRSLASVWPWQPLWLPWEGLGCHSHVLLVSNPKKEGVMLRDFHKKWDEVGRYLLRLALESGFLHTLPHLLLLEIAAAAAAGVALASCYLSFPF